MRRRARRATCLLVVIACVALARTPRANASRDDRRPIATNAHAGTSTPSTASSTSETTNRTIEDVVRDLRDALEALDAERDEKSSSELAEAMTRVEALAANANATAADEARAASETGDEDEAMHILREVVERWSGSESVGTSGRERGGEVKTTASRSRSTAAADEKDADEDKEEDGDGDDREEEKEEESEEGEEGEEEDTAGDAKTNDGDIDGYLLDTSTPKKSSRPKIVNPTLGAGESSPTGAVLAATGQTHGESSIARALARMAARTNAAFIRPGECACEAAGGAACACVGACALTEPSVAAQTARLLASKERVGVIVSTGGREKWMSDVVRDDQRWIGEVASPTDFAFERMYVAARHYITGGARDAAPVPELYDCDNFTTSLREIRKKCEDMRCKTNFADMQKYVSSAQKKAILSCPGFVSNPQTARLRGTEVRANETVKKAAMRAQAKYGTLVPRDGRDGEALVALTYGYDFTLSDLVFHRDADAPERSYNAASEPKDLRDMIEESNPVDAELFRRAREAMEDVMATPTFEARLGALLAMTNAASAFCDERKVCSSGRAVKDAIDFDFSHVSSLGEFPMSCGDAIATKEIKCVDDWFACEGPDAEGSVWRSGRAHASAPSAPASPGGKNAAATGKEENSTAAAADETKTASSQRKTTTADADDEEKKTPTKTSTAAEDEPSTPTVADTTFRAAVDVHNQSPWLWYSIAFILLAVLITSFVHSRLEAAAAESPASSLELGASILRERAFTAKETGREMSTNDEFWTSARPASPTRDSARGTGRDAGTAGRRPGRGSRRNARQRGPMTAEERAFYDEL